MDEEQRGWEDTLYADTTPWSFTKGYEILVQKPSVGRQPPLGVETHWVREYVRVSVNERVPDRYDSLPKHQMKVREIVRMTYTGRY